MFIYTGIHSFCDQDGICSVGMLSPMRLSTIEIVCGR